MNEVAAKTEKEINFEEFPKTGKNLRLGRKKILSQKKVVELQ